MLSGNTATPPKKKKKKHQKIPQSIAFLCKDDIQDLSPRWLEKKRTLLTNAKHRMRRKTSMVMSKTEHNLGTIQEYVHITD